MRALRRRYGAARVLLLDTAAHPNRAARLHTAECPMCRMAKRGGRIKRIEADTETIADLNERGFPVRECKCIISK